MDCTKADAVMVARGGVGNPFLVTQIDRYFRTGETLPNPKVSQQIDWLIQFMDAVIEESGEERAFRRLRGYVTHFIPGCFCSKGFRRKLVEETTDRENLLDYLEKIRSKMGDQTINSNGRRPHEDFE